MLFTLKMQTTRKAMVSSARKELHSKCYLCNPSDERLSTSGDCAHRKPGARRRRDSEASARERARPQFPACLPAAVQPRRFAQRRDEIVRLHPPPPPPPPPPSWRSIKVPSMAVMAAIISVAARIQTVEALAVQRDGIFLRLRASSPALPSSSSGSGSSGRGRGWRRW